MNLPGSDEVEGTGTDVVSLEIDGIKTRTSGNPEYYVERIPPSALSILNQEGVILNAKKLKREVGNIRVAK